MSDCSESRGQLRRVTWANEASHVVLLTGRFDLTRLDLHNNLSTVHISCFEERAH